MSTYLSAAPVRRVLATSLAALLVITGVAVWGATPAEADAVVLQPGELVVNGDAEQAVTVGWTGSLQRHTHGSGGYPGSVIVNSAGATGGTFPGGTALFNGAGSASTATQTIDLTPSAAAIDNANVDARLSAYVGGYASQQDNATLTYAFRDGGGTPLATVVFGPVMAADRGSASGFVPFARTQRLPVGTRNVVITIQTQRFTPSANDGYVDNISLILDAPSPVAAPDTANTTQGSPVTLTPYSNDTPGTGAAIGPDSVRLLDGANLVTTLTTAQGTYVVDTGTGDVEFTPVPDFFGTTTPVPYRFTDSSGQVADSTLTIDVAIVPNPSLSLVKSASPSDPADYLLGTAVTYSFVVSNTGNVVINNIQIGEDVFTGSGPLPAPTCPVTTLAPAAQTTCTTTYTITANDIAALGITNTATASGTPDGSATPVDSDPSTFEIPVAPRPGIALVKSADASGAVRAGDPVAYSFLVTNTGNVAIDNIQIGEDGFSGTGSLPTPSCPTLPLQPGAIATCTATYSLTQADVDTGTVTNTATASANPASGGTVQSSPSTAAITIAPTPAFTFVKTADRTAITAAGQAVNYTFRISNTGNVTLSNPVVTEASFTGAGTLGAITCASASVAPGADLDCSAGYTTVAADLDEVSIANSATAEIDDPQLNPLTAPVSSVAIPVVLPAAATDPSDPDPDPGSSGPSGPVVTPAPVTLASTGADAYPLTLLAGGLVLAGFALLAAGTLRPRPRRHQPPNLSR